VDFTPSALLDSIAKLLQSSFSEPVWVVARLAGAKTHSSGFANWMVVDDVDAPSVKLELALTPRINTAVMTKLRHANVALVDGLNVRLLVRPGVSRFGKLNADVIEIDVEHSTRRAKLSPQEVFQELSRSGHAQLQQRLTRAEFPFNIAVIGARSSDGVRDALAVLESSSIAFRVATFDTPVQGAHAPARIIESLDAVAGLKNLPDVVLLVRGGGERSDLAAFDDVDLARHVCSFPVPVLCGIGHEADTTVCDLICHHAERTPTGIATWLRDVVTAGFAQRSTLAASSFAAVSERLQLATAAIDRRATSLSLVNEHLDAVSHRLESSLQQTFALAQRCFDTHATSLDAASVSAFSAASSTLASVSASLDVTSATLAQLHPHRALERGFAIVSDTDGRLVRSHALAHPTAVHIRVSDGVIDASTTSSTATPPVIPASKD
jgi:exodeoxyribonuclease VII large subunit